MNQSVVNQTQVNSITEMLLKIINHPKNAKERSNFIEALKNRPELLDAFFSEQFDQWFLQEVMNSEEPVVVSNIAQTIAAVKEKLLTDLEK